MQTQALFTNIAERIQQELAQAEQSIYIAVAWFTNKTLFDTLLAKAQQGVEVQLLSSNDFINKTHGVDFSQLNIGKSVAYLIGDGDKDLMHNKFCVIDDYTVITGSYNWSKKAEKNHENIVITTGDRLLVEQFIGQFKKIRDSYFNHQDTVAELPLDKIIKRLQIVKNYVSLEDDEDIERETQKLAKYDFQQNIGEIIASLQNHQFSQSINLIDKFISEHHQMTVYQDVDLMALKLEIRHLEHQITAYDNEKMELEHLLNEFQHRHTLELGWYISRLLHLRKLICQDDPEKLAEAEEDERTYNQQVEEETSKTIHKLDKEQQKRLKKAFRKASQLCHPDRVDEELKEVAEAVFVELNDAYKENDIAKVEQILADLENGTFTPRSETVNEVDKLKTIVQSLKIKLAQLEQEIITIKDSEEYATISAIADWDDYFAQTKAQLIDEIDNLEMKL